MIMKCQICGKEVERLLADRKATCFECKVKRQRERNKQKRKNAVS